jgi:hypothetical protein
MAAPKRHRTSSSSAGTSLDLSEPTESTSKALRTQRSPTSSARQLICTLPPTCNPPQNKPSKLTDSADLERHYATYHAHVCEEHGCNCVFPDERLLELVSREYLVVYRRSQPCDSSKHQTECHDPLAAVRKERGEKIVGSQPLASSLSDVVSSLLATSLLAIECLPRQSLGVCTSFPHMVFPSSTSLQSQTKVLEAY